jgi:hypothetical protein
VGPVLRNLSLRALAVATILAVAEPAAAQSDAQLQAAVSSSDDQQGADIVGAFKDSLRLLLIEHGTRVIFQEKTRRELDGPFFPDYRRSARWPNQWNDTDAWWVNYIGHPIHGSAAGYLWIDHEPGDPVTISRSRNYWTSRARATAFAATYSLQFELGPLSEASIGNVGMQPETTGWVDHVVTPLGAFGFIVAEDALDRYFVQWAEERMTNQVVRATLRIFFNPGRALANGAGGRLPWHREGRPLGWR